MLGDMHKKEQRKELMKERDNLLARRSGLSEEKEGTTEGRSHRQSTTDPPHQL